MALKLSTGREFEANRGIVGINTDLEVFEGYDGGIRGAGLEDYWESDEEWSGADRAALADMMIERWQQFKAAALKRP